MSTALSGKSKERSTIPDPSIEGSEQPVIDSTKNVFQIGINCEADSLFNKDPKDANKYEIEGSKTQGS